MTESTLFCYSFMLELRDVINLCMFSELSTTDFSYECCD